MPPIPASGRARAVEIARHRRSLPLDLLNDPAYALDSPHWDWWFRDEHDVCRRAFFAQAPALPQEPTAYPALPPGHEQELWFEEEVDEGDDPEMQAAYEASRRSLVEDDIKLWEAVLAAAQPPPAAPLLSWQHMAQEQEAKELELEPVPPLPRGLLGRSWGWTGSIWSPPLSQQEEPA